MSAPKLLELRGRALGHVVRELPRALGTEALGVAVAVEEVVDDLEEQADVLAEGDPRGVLVGRHARDVEPDPDSGDEQAPGLQPMQLLEVERRHP